TPSVLKTFIIGLENLLTLKVKIIRCDNGTEFKNTDLNHFCVLKGIKREFSVPRTPQQNGIAERKNRTLIEAARTLLAYSLLPIPFWTENNNKDAHADGKEHDDDIQKFVSLDIHSTSIGAQTRNQGDKTENKDKGKTPVVTIIRFKDLNKEFEEYINNSSNGVNAAGSLVSAARLNFTNSTNDLSAAGSSNTATCPSVENSAKPMPFPSEVEVERLLALPTLPPSPLISLLPPSVKERLARATLGRLRALSPSTHHPLHPSPPIPPLPSLLYLPPPAPTSLPLPSPPLPTSLFILPPVDHREDILKAELPPRKRLCLTALTYRYEVGESLTAAARPTGGLAAAVKLSPTSYLYVRAVRHNLLRGGNSALRMSSLWSTGGSMNSDVGSGGDGNGNDVGAGGGSSKVSRCTHMVRATIWVGTLGSGDHGSAGAAKHLARRSFTEGGSSEISGDGGSVGKASSLSTSTSDGKGMGFWGQINILALTGVV
nr:putative ribonuclease H-like domain-containing protein [Tanacetum cinerariifolium]